MLTWLIIFLSNGLFPKDYLSGYIRVAIMLSAIALYALKKDRFKIKRRIAIVLIIVLLLQVLTILVNGIYWQLDLFHMGIVSTMAFFSSVIEEKEFIDQYRLGIYYVCLVSLALYIIGYFGVLSCMPKVMLFPTNMDNAYSILGTFVVQLKQTWTYYRNFGIFSEPGQFQIYIVIGLFVELFIVEVFDFKHFFVYVVTLISCNSTNGFIAGGIIIVSLVLYKTSNMSECEKKLRNIIVMMIPISIIFLIGYGDRITIYDEAKAKVAEFLFRSYTYDDLGTGLERRRAIELAALGFIKNPLVGIGYRGVDQFIKELTTSRIIMTFSPLMWYTRWGILYGLFANVTYFGFFLKFIKNTLLKCVVFVGLFLMISAQAITSDSLTWIVIFYFCRKSFWYKMRK